MLGVRDRSVTTVGAICTRTGSSGPGRDLDPTRRPRVLVTSCCVICALDVTSWDGGGAWGPNERWVCLPAVKAVTQRHRSWQAADLVRPLSVLLDHGRSSIAVRSSSLPKDRDR